VPLGRRTACAAFSRPPPHKKRGLKAQSTRTEAGERTYRIAK
jgi:hypothetical protein